MGSFTETFQSFMTSIQVQFTYNIQQLLNIYSPGLAINFYLSSISGFLNESTIPTAAYFDLLNLYLSKYSRSNSTICWSEYQETTAQIYSKSSLKFLDLVQCQTNMVEGRLKDIQTEIKGVAQNFGSVFDNVSRSPSNAVSLLTDFVS